MRLEGEQADQTAGQERAAFHEDQRAAKQCGGDEAVLPDHGVRQYAGKRTGEQKADAIADDAANGRRIGGKCQQGPGRLRLHIGQEREQRRRKQERRRINPGIVALEGMSDGCNFGRFVERDVVGGGRVAIEDLPAAGPHVDEVGGDGVTLRVDEPSCLEQTRPQDRPPAPRTARSK